MGGMITMQRRPVVERETRRPNAALQTKRAEESAATTDTAMQRALSNQSGGQELDDSTRSYLEPRFGHSLADVRIHADTEAAQLARAVDASAFTTGNHMYFGSGAYSPGTTQGMHLLAHEATHTIQQAAGPVAGTPGPGGVLVSDPGDSFEQEAEQAAQAVMSGGNARIAAATAPASATTVQRQPVVQRGPELAAVPVVIVADATAGGAAAGGALTLDAASKASGIATGLVGAGNSAVSIGGAVTGKGGVQTAQLPDSWISPRDKQNLELIAQYRLINEYVKSWVQRYPDLDPVTGQPKTAPANAAPGGGATPPATDPNAPSPPPSPAPAPPPAPAPTPAPASDAKPPPGAVATRGKLDEAILKTVESAVKAKLEEDLNRNVRTAPAKRLMWSDNGTHEPVIWGTQGEVEFVDVKSTAILEELRLTDDAAKIPDLKPDRLGDTIVATQLRGGRMREGPNMSIGWNDNLAITLSGGAAQQLPDEFFHHGVLRFETAWKWDHKETYWPVDIHASDQPGDPPAIQEGTPQGTPDAHFYS